MRSAILFLALTCATGCVNGQAPRPLAVTEGDVVRVDTTGLRNGSGAFFTYRTAAGGTVEFIVYRDSLGTPRVVLDACRNCFRWRQGYSLEDGYLTCRKCGERFHIDSFEGGRASCAPIPLPVIIAGGETCVPVRDLELAQKYF